MDGSFVVSPVMVYLAEKKDHAWFVENQFWPG